MKNPDKKSFGLVSFPYYVDFETDEKLRVIIEEFGLKGEMIITKLFAWTYGKAGYYTDWSEDGQQQFASRFAYLQTSANIHNEVIHRMLKWGILHRGMYDQYLILTSKKIQETWVDLARKEKKNMRLLKIDGRYNLVDVTKKPVRISTGVLKGIWDAADLEPLNSTDQQAVLRLIEWIKAKAPRVLQMKELFTPEEVLRITKDANNIRATEVLLAMHNWGKLFQNINANLTFWNWYRRHEQKFNSIPEPKQVQQKTRKEL